MGALAWFLSAWLQMLLIPSARHGACEAWHRACRRKGTGETRGCRVRLTAPPPAAPPLGRSAALVLGCTRRWCSPVWPRAAHSCLIG